MGFDYFDASEDRRASYRAPLVDLLEHDLVSAGFRPVGCAVAVQRATGREQISQVWVGERGRVMAGAAFHCVDLITLFEDGTIVKTATKESWYAQTWRLRRHPADRHDYIALRARLEPVLALHRERIAAVEARSRVVPASMQSYLATRLRTGEVIVADVIRRYRVALVCMVIAGFAVATWSTFAAHQRHFPRFSVPVLAGLAAMIVMPPVFQVVLLWLSPLVARLRPGPPPRPASVLLELASALPPRRLRDRPSNE